MFDIGFSELVLCAIVALLVFGPEKLPSLIRDVQAMRNQVQKAWVNTKQSLEHELNEMNDKPPRSPDN